MSLRRDNELLSDEDKLGPQERFCLGFTIIGAILGLLSGELPGVLFGAGAGFGLAVLIINLMTWISNHISR